MRLNSNTLANYDGLVSEILNIVLQIYSCSVLSNRNSLATTKIWSAISSTISQFSWNGSTPSARSRVFSWGGHWISIRWYWNILSRWGWWVTSLLHIKWMISFSNHILDDETQVSAVWMLNHEESRVKLKPHLHFYFNLLLLCSDHPFFSQFNLIYTQVSLRNYLLD